MISNRLFACGLPLGPSIRIRLSKGKPWQGPSSSIALKATAGALLPGRSGRAPRRPGGPLAAVPRHRRARFVRRQLSWSAARHGDGHRRAHSGAHGGELTRMAKARIPAIAYLRTSSAANVGADKDSDTRQRQAISGFAKRAGFDLVGEFYDAAVSGKDPIEGRAGFKALLERVVGNGVRVRHRRGCQPVCPASADPGGRHFVAGWPGRARPDRRRTISESCCPSGEPSVQPSNRSARWTSSACMASASGDPPVASGEPFVVTESITHCLKDFDGFNTLAIDGLMLPPTGLSCRSPIARCACAPGPTW